MEIDAVELPIGVLVWNCRQPACRVVQLIFQSIHPQDIAPARAFRIGCSPDSTHARTPGKGLLHFQWSA